MGERNHDRIISHYMELILVRHGLPVRRENTDGPADPDLAPDGHAQAQLFAQYVMNHDKVDAIYTSPLRRAVQTASPLAAMTGLTPTIVPARALAPRSLRFSSLTPPWLPRFYQNRLPTITK